MSEPKSVTHLCCEIASEIKINGISVLTAAHVAHHRASDSDAKYALCEGRRFVSELSRLLDELKSALEARAK